VDIQYWKSKPFLGGSEKIFLNFLIFVLPSIPISSSDLSQAEIFLSGNFYLPMKADLRVIFIFYFFGNNQVCEKYDMSLLIKPL
jgi:hypothetical protein